MITKSKMTDVGTTEMREAVGGLNYATMQFLRRTHNLSNIQVSVLKYHNRLEDPAKFQNLIPDGNSVGVQGPPRILG